MTLLLLCLHTQAEDTNIYYVTDDGHSGNIRNDPGALDEAKKNKECLPADAFPEGNWGEIKNGVQLSLRFETNTFAVGQPVNAITLLRNVTNLIMSYDFGITMGMDTRPIRIIMTDSNGTPVSTKAVASPTGLLLTSTRSRELLPQTQHKYIERLDNLYDMQSNTLYFVTAEIRIRAEEIRISYPKSITVKSAKVPIRISN